MAQRDRRHPQGASVIARLLFGMPGDWPDRNQGALVGAIVLLIMLAHWLADVVGGAVASLP